MTGVLVVPTVDNVHTALRTVKDAWERGDTRPYTVITEDGHVTIERSHFGRAAYCRTWSWVQAREAQQFIATYNTGNTVDLVAWLTPARTHDRATWMQNTWCRDKAHPMLTRMQPDIFTPGLWAAPPGPWREDEQRNIVCKAAGLDPSELDAIGGFHGDTARMGIMLAGHNVDDLYALLGLK